MDHKRAFVDRHLPSAEKLVVVGHSIGALMMLDLLPRLKASGRFGSVSGIGLFPTIERMAESPMGLKMSHYFAYFRWLVVFFAAVFSLIFPRVVRLKLLRWYFGPKVEENSIVATDDIACARAVSGIMFMAHDEMRMVRIISHYQSLSEKSCRTFPAAP
jgi:pimeloyl-ACP methyl ester carboxylesterase